MYICKMKLLYLQTWLKIDLEPGLSFFNHPVEDVKFQIMVFCSFLTTVTGLAMVLSNVSPLIFGILFIKH